MAAKMDSVELQDNGEHQKGLPSDHSLLETSVALDVICDDSPICPRIGSEYQVEIPNLATEDEQRQLATSSSDSCRFLGYDYPVGIGLDIPITWVSHPPSEVNKKEEELRAQRASEIEVKGCNKYSESQVTPINPICDNTSKCASYYQDAFPVPPANQVESGTSQANDENSTCSSGECLNYDKSMMQQTETARFTPLPGLSVSVWSDTEKDYFLLGLYIFGKNLSLVSKFVRSKTIGDVLTYYYGRFYRSDAYQRWSDCRKIRTRRCILGQRIFTGWRQQELISRLQLTIPKEAHDSLIEVFKSHNEGQTSFEEFVFTLKSIVGMEAFVGAIGIGKGKHDLTGVILDPARTNQAVSARPEIPAGKACSSLASEDIIKFLTGDFRLSKTRSNDLFWEAVWPRLLARGWHSEQPKDATTTKNALVFLMPGIKKFSRRKLIKGTHYFDSVSDVLKRVAADPILLELESDGMDNSITDDKNGWLTDMKAPQNDLSNNQKQPYVPPRVQYRDHDILKFTVIDTSLVDGEEPFNVRELRSLPADANISFGPSHRSGNVRSSSSSEEESDDRSSEEQEQIIADDKDNEMIQEQSEQVTADDKDVQMAPVYKEIQMDALQNIGTASSSVAAVNGHTSNEQHVDISNGKGDEKDLTCFFGVRAKSGRHEYLSPVSKRRRFVSCNNDRTSRRSFSFSAGDGLKKEEARLLPGSSRPTDVDVGGTFQTRTLMNCSTGNMLCEKMNATKFSTKERPGERRTLPNSSNQERILEQKATAVDDVPFSSNNVPYEVKVAQEGAQAASLIDLNKPEAPVDDVASAILSIGSFVIQGSMKRDEAPSVSDSKMAPDVPVATGNPVHPQPDQPLEINPRRHGTRNRPPTARALEAVAFGLLGGNKRKSDHSTASRPSRRTRKSAEKSVSSPTGTDRDNSSVQD